MKVPAASRRSQRSRRLQKRHHSVSEPSSEGQEWEKQEASAQDPITLEEMTDLTAPQ